MMEYEERLVVATPEDVEVTLTLAGVQSRFCAALVDLGVQYFVFNVVITFLSAFSILGAGSDLATAILVAIMLLAGFAVMFGYYIFFELLWRGRTLGKAALGIHVVGTGGRPPSVSESVRRNLLRIVDFLPGFYGVGLLSILLTAKRQRLGDLVGGTLVVKKSRAAAGMRPFLVAPRWPGTLDAWDTSGVASDDDLLIRRYLERRPSLTPVARTALAWRLTERYRPLVSGADPGEPPEYFLEGVVCARWLRTMRTAGPGSAPPWVAGGPQAWPTPGPGGPAGVGAGATPEPGSQPGWGSPGGPAGPVPRSQGRSGPMGPPPAPGIPLGAPLPGHEPRPGWGGTDPE